MLTHFVEHLGRVKIGGSRNKAKAKKSGNLSTVLGWGREPVVSLN